MNIKIGTRDNMYEISIMTDDCAVYLFLVLSPDDFRKFKELFLNTI